MVISVDQLGKGPSELAIVVPLTRTNRTALDLRIDPPEGGLQLTSFAKCEDLRSVSRERLSKPLGRVSPAVLRQVEDRLRLILGL